MSVDYTFYTSIRSEGALADHFGGKLGLRGNSAEKQSPLVGEALWVSIRADLDEDWAEEAELLGADHLSMVTFVPDKGLSWPDETRLLAEIMQSIVSLWDSHPDSTGALAVYEQLMLQRLPHDSVVLDETVADTSEEGFNVAHAFDYLLDTFEVRDIKTDL